MRFLIYILTIATFQSAFAIDFDQFLKNLKTTGVQLEVHGIDKELGRYVGTFRDKDFFDYQNFALTTKDPVIQKWIEGLSRHDVIKVTGDIPSPGRPFMHIVITKAELVQARSGEYPPDHEHDVVLPEALRGLSEIVIKVHAIEENGRMIVGDYKQATLPIVVPRAQWPSAKDLSRGDLIKIKYEIREEPQAPVHLQILKDEGSIKVIESMKALHGTKVEYQGALVLFPKSPQVNFNVFALQKDLGDGYTREYTLVNFENPELFVKIREQMQKLWDASPAVQENDRNKWIKRKLQLKVKGVFNFVDASQANPQILVDSLDDITIVNQGE